MSCSLSPPKAPGCSPRANRSSQAGIFLEAHTPCGRGELALRAPGPAISSMVSVSQKIHQPCAGCTGTFHIYQGFGRDQWCIQGRIQLVGCSNPWVVPATREAAKPASRSAAHHKQHSIHITARGSRRQGEGRNRMDSFLKKLYTYKYVYTHAHIHTYTHTCKERGLGLNSGSRNTKPEQD